MDTGLRAPEENQGFVIPGRGLAREPGNQEHGPAKSQHRSVFIDSGPDPAGHPGMTAAMVSEQFPCNWDSFTGSPQAGRDRSPARGKQLRRD